MTGELPQFVRDMLNNPPPAGEGIHNWLFRVARHLHAHMGTIEMHELLKSQVADCGRVVTDKEISDAIKSSQKCAWHPDGDLNGNSTQAQAKWPSVNQEQRAAIIRDGGGLVDLWELSPFRIESNTPRSEEVIDALFPDNPLLCCGLDNCRFDTKLRSEWRGELAELQLIVPSPMIERTGLTQKGEESAHSLNNTGPRRFLIVEFDKGTSDEHAALLIHLAGKAPLVCVVHSGGKSLHAWFYVEGEAEETTRKFFTYAVSIGADKQLWTRSQFVRMPDGTRDNGKRQTIYFLNFNPLQP